MKHPPGNKRHTGTTQPTDSSFALLLMRDSSHSMSRSISPHYFPSAVLIICPTSSCVRSTCKCWSDGVDRTEPPEGWTGVAVG